MKTMLMLGGVCGFTAAVIAADTRDYSSYVKLKGSTTVTVTAGWPAAASWDPEGEMSEDGYYLIPAGKTLKSATTTGADGGTWPMAELAIAGTFNPTATGSRSHVAITPHLAILAGGRINISSAYGTILGGENGTIDIRGSEDNPSVINYNYTSPNDKPSYYAQILSDIICADAEAVVKFTRSLTDGWDLQRATRVRCFRDFAGKVIVEGEHSWLRPDTSSTGFNIGGTLELAEGGNFYCGNIPLTIGTLKIGSGSTFQLVNGCVAVVTDSLELAEGAILDVPAITSTEFVYHDGNVEAPQIPFLSVCGASKAAAVDRAKLLAAIRCSGKSFKGAVCGIPHLMLVEKVRDDGGVDFSVSHEPIVRQIKNCTSGSGPYGNGNYEGYLSDGLEITPDKSYFTNSKYIYINTDYVFPGKTLVVNGVLGSYSRSFTATDMRLMTGAWTRQMSANCNFWIKGSATLYGVWNLRVCGSGTQYIESELSGDGDILITLDVGKIIDRNSGSSKVGYFGAAELSGANTAYKGRVMVGWGRTEAELERNTEGLTNITLRVSSGANLGGDLEAFTFDALRIGDTCTLSVTDTATFNAVNRGWCLMDGSTVSVAANDVATVNETITYGGTVTKTGAGTLILGGASKGYDAENDAALDEANGAKLVVAAGNVGAASANAFAALSGLEFAAGTKFVVDAANAAEMPMGVDLSAVTLVTPADGVPVEFVSVPEMGGQLAIAAFASAADAAKFVIRKPEGLRVMRSVETVGEKFVLKAKLARCGLRINFR